MPVNLCRLGWRYWPQELLASPLIAFFVCSILRCVLGFTFATVPSSLPQEEAFSGPHVEQQRLLEQPLSLRLRVDLAFFLQVGVHHLREAHVCLASFGSVVS